MNSQELRNLQEAYLEVVMNESEGSYGQTPKALQRAIEINKKRILAPQMSIFSKRNNKFQNERTKKIRDIGKHYDRLALYHRTGPDSDSDPYYGSGNRAARRAGKKVKDGRISQSNESYDIYDIILSHLLDEGYADTVESAEVIMVNMSEDWREGILSEAILEYQPFKDKRKGVKSKVKKLESEKSGDPKDLGFRNARLQKRIDSMKTVLGKKNKEITSASQQKSYDNMAKGGFKHHDDPQSKYYIK